MLDDNTLALDLRVAVTLVVAPLLGAAIGMERQWRQRMAGLRTNALVALGAAIFVAFSTMVDHEVSPTRVAAQVVSGIGFLGAGVIMRQGLNVRGLNTAATLWCAAAVGVLVGAGYVLAGTVSALLVVLVNVTLRPLARRIDRTPAGDTEVVRRYRVRVRSPQQREAFVRALVLHSFQGGALRFDGLHSHDIEGSDLVEVEAILSGESRQEESLERIVGRLSLEPYVHAARWSVDDDEP